MKHQKGNNLTKMKNYSGQCHCGAIRFEFTGETITAAMRCNCSICRRKNAIMSQQYYPADSFKIISGKECLTIYRFEPELVNHYFCKHCGIYPFHDGVANPGIYRINLCCVDELEPWQLPIRIFDGKDSWKYLN